MIRKFIESIYKTQIKLCKNLNADTIAKIVIIHKRNIQYAFHNEMVQTSEYFYKINVNLLM